MWQILLRRTLLRVRDAEARARLTAIYDECGARVHAYAVRHCGPNDAEDVVAETFAIACKRLDQIPDPPIGWLLVTARNTLANKARSSRRADSLVERLSSHGPKRGGGAPAAEEAALARVGLLETLERLTKTEREALLLIAWDGLTQSEAAAVAGCSQRAFRARLSRARGHLDTLLSPDPPPTLSHPPLLTRPVDSIRSV